MANPRESQEIADCEQPPQLPEEEETMSEKFSRFSSTEDGSEDVVPPSNLSFLSGKLFGIEERKYLMKVCGGMARASVISKPTVKQILGKEEGKKLLKTFILDQLNNQLKFERRLNNRQPKET